MTPRSAQPPASWIHCGRSQWNSVGYGVMPASQQRVDEPVVVVESRPVDRSARVGDHARPRDAEPVRPETELAQQRDVLRVAVVLVAGDVSRGAVDDPCPACARTGPRSTRPCRPPARRPRPGRTEVAAPHVNPSGNIVCFNMSGRLLVPRRARSGCVCGAQGHPSRTSTLTRGAPGLRERDQCALDPPAVDDDLGGTQLHPALGRRVTSIS